MKKVLLYALAIMPIAALAQDQPQAFEVKGKIGTLNTPAKAYLVYQEGANRVTDSATMINGAFDFKGQLLSPSAAFLVIDRDGVGLDKLDKSVDNLSFYVDKGTTEINSADSASKAQITGSKINDENKKLMAELKPISVEAAQLKAEIESATPQQQNSPDFQSAMDTRRKELITKQKATLKLFVANNPDSYLSLLVLYSIGGPQPDPTELDPMYASLSDRLKGTEAAKQFKKALDGLRATAVGVMAPDFTQNDVNGAPVKLSSYRGKYVLVDFWASWCGPCRNENPNVVKAYNKYKDKNFTVLGVSLDRSNGKADWLAAIKADNLTWTQVSDLQFWDNAVAVLYNVKSIPANFLIDPTGKIIARDLHGEDLDAKLDEVLGK